MELVAKFVTSTSLFTVSTASPRGSFIPGLEFAGVVEAVGAAAANQDPPGTLRTGDQVIGVTRFGGYATALNVSVRHLLPLRPGWSFAEGAAFPVQALTAWYGLVRLGELRRDDVVLLHSAAGGVGLNALAILASTGARTIATVGGAAKRAWLVEHRGLAPEHVIVRDRRSFGADLDRALATLGAKGLDLVFDAVAGPYFKPAYRRLRPEGRLVVYGAADFMPRGTRVNWLRLAARYLRRPRVDPLAMVNDNRSVLGFNLIWLWNSSEGLTGAYDALDTLITAPPLVGRRFPFAETPAAMRHLQSGDSIGKVVLENA